MIFLAIGTIIIYITTSDALEAEEFADYVVEDVPKEIDEINDIAKWSGWEKMNTDWRVDVYDSDGGLIYTNGKYMMMSTFWMNSERDIKSLGAHVVINAITSAKTEAYMEIFRFVDWVFFIFIFSLLFRKIEKYTYEISDGISILAGGEMKHRIPLKGKNELAMIASNINSMAEALEERTTQKERSDNERDDVITNLAHDIRTPITVLEGYLSMLINDEGLSKEKQKEYLSISLNKCNELTSRADNIFEYVRLNNKREKLEFTVVSARKYIMEKFEEMTMILTREGFEFQVDIALHENHDIKIDKAVTQRVFDNLLSNIIKYASESYPVGLKAYTDENNIVVKLRNKSKDKINIESERLFERTVSGDVSRNGKSEGLGLAICKLVMEMQNGKIDVEIEDEYIEFSLYFLD